VLFSSSPGVGHVFPLVPLAWATRSAGHQVLVITAGSALEATGGAGLPAFDAAPGFDITDTFRSFASRHPGIAPGSSPGQGASSVFERDRLPVVAGMFAEVSDRMAGRAVEVARAWRPDLVVHTPMDGAGLVAAAAVGAPVIEHGLGLTTGDVFRRPLAERLRPTAERLGVSAELGDPAAVIDTCPPSMRQPGTEPGLAMRYPPYNGGGRLPDWLIEPADRPRVCVTLGSVVPMMGGTALIPGIVEAFSTLDVEVVLALGNADLSGLGTMPANVRVGGWVPLSELLPSCAAIVHHGGAGTTGTALAIGVPQLVLPHGADQHMNAAAVVRRGVGLSHLPSEVDVETLRAALRCLLEERELAQAALEVRMENAGRPAPSEIVPRLTELAGAYRVSG
jgi:UDP:flavonoid glycosyltransferase YjiC (YdhE family)